MSRKLTALEARLGVRLLARSTRRTALSEPGRRYLESCRDVLGRVAMVREFASLAATRLRAALRT